MEKDCKSISACCGTIWNNNSDEVDVMNEILSLLDEYIVRFQRIIDRFDSIINSFPKVPACEEEQWGTEIQKYLRNIGKC